MKNIHLRMKDALPMFVVVISCL